MNNKGFTLVEMLAVVVILSLVLGIASYSVIGSINSSKKASEKIFVDKLGNAVDEYLSMYGSTLSKVGTEFCIRNCENIENQVKIYRVNSFYLKDIVNKNYLEEEKIVNPFNKRNCLEGSVNPEVVVYKDTEFVYYYYVDLSGDYTSCEISDDNSILTNMPVNIINILKNNGVFLPQNLLEKAG